MSDNNETPELTQEEKDIEQAIMYLRMTVRQLQSGDWSIVGSTYSTTPVAVGENKRGLDRYESRVSGLQLFVKQSTGDEPITEDMDAPTNLTSPREPVEAKS